MEKTRERTLLGVTLGHIAHDSWYGVAPILMATLASELHLSNADIGLILLMYQITSSLTQPVFGRLSERIGGRPLAVASILWTTLWFSASLFAGSKIMLMVCVGLAGFGSGAWHPQGAANATVSGGKRWGATAASVFFLGGMVGTAILGSALGGYLLHAFGRRSLLLLSLIAVFVSLTIVRRLVPQHITPQESKVDVEEKQASGSAARVGLLLILLLIGTALRRVPSESINSFFPKSQQDLGISSATYGLIMSLHLMAGAVGGVLGSYFSDRTDLRVTLCCTMVLGALSLFAFTQTQGTLSYAMLVLTGFLLGPSHTLFMVVGQRQFPQRMAMIAGVFLGWAFISGSGGAWVFGMLADRVGLAAMFATLPWLLLGAAVLGYFAVPGKTAQLGKQSKEPAAG